GGCRVEVPIQLRPSRASARFARGCIQGDRLQSGCLCLPPRNPTLRKSRIRGSILGIFLNGPPKILLSGLPTRYGSLVPVVTSEQVCFMGFWFGSMGLRRFSGLSNCDGNTHLPCNFARKSGFQLQQVAHILVVFSRPDVCLVRHLQQLGGNTNLAAPSTDASFQNVIYAKIPANLADGL